MLTKMEAIILVGIAGCGKTAFCKKFLPHHTRVSLDDIHKHNRSVEDRLINQNLSSGNNIVIDDTNLTRSIRSRHIENIKNFDARINAIFFNFSIHRIQLQNIRRDNPIPSHVLFHMRKQLEMPIYDEGFDYIQTLNDNFRIY